MAITDMLGILLKKAAQAESVEAFEKEAECLLMSHNS